MRRLGVLLAVLAAAHLALLAAGPRPSAPSSATPLKVGVVFDVGGRGDKSFNDGAWLGADRARRELGAVVRFIEPGEGTDREAGLRLLAAEGMDLVVGVGFIFTDDLLQLAAEYPQTRFAGVDFAVPMDSLGKPLPLPPNLVALKFREEEGSFLVGALAALAGGSTTLGFVGGMESPLIRKFEVGYIAGAKHVCAQCTVLSAYAGVTPAAFRNPGKGKELALSQYGRGARVIYHASGSTGLGVFEAARSARALAIGVDADQFAEAPGFVLTSMVKGIDAAVFDAVQRVQDGTFVGGVRQFGLKERGVGFVDDANNRALIPETVRQRLARLRDSIVAGHIVVPSI
jgi:basic membrane protein A and related proteins